MRHAKLPAILLLTLLLTGCCCPAINSAREAARRAQSMNNMRMLALGCLNYREVYEDAWPQSLADVREFVPDFDQVMVNPLTGDNPGYEYVKPTVEDGFSQTVMLYQLRNGARDATMAKGYADGSVEQ